MNTNRICCITLWTLLCVPAPGPAFADRANPGLVPLTGWEYFAGDTAAPLVPSAVIRSREWIPMATPYAIPAAYRGNALWLRTRLPAYDGLSPALYVGQVHSAMQVYCWDRCIFRLGDSSSRSAGFIGWNQNLIQLPSFKEGDAVVFRIQLNRTVAGIEGNVLLGSSGGIVKAVWDLYFLNLAFAILVLALGIMSLCAYFIFQREKLLAGIALCLIPMAVFISVNSSLLQILYQWPSVYYHLDYSSFMCAAVGGFYAIEQVMAGRYKFIGRSIWRIHVVILLTTIFCEIFTTITYLDILPVFLIVLTLSMIVSGIAMMLSLRAGGYENRMLMAGMGGFFFFAILEIAFYYRGGVNGDFGYNVQTVHFGVLLFVISLIGAMLHRYFNANKQKDAARQKELEAVKRENEAREQFSMKLLESQENERNRIALELHDSVGQKILLMKNQLTANIRREPEGPNAESLKKISDLTSETLQEIRSISHNLRPQHLDQLGLTTAIETLVEKVRESSDVRFLLHADDIAGLIPPEQEINFFRIVQEGITNIVKHSRATEASLSIRCTEDTIHLVLKDNGIGVRSANMLRPDGMGLTGMQERARMIGATLSIDLSEQSGTVITIACPLLRRTT